MWFKKSKEDEGVKLLNEYIKVALDMGMSEKKIRHFLLKTYKEDTINKAFELNKMEVKMAREDFEEDYEEDFEEDEDEDSQIPEPPKPVKKKKVQRPEPSEQKPKLSIDSVLTNHEQRLLNFEQRLLQLESTLFRRSNY